MKLAHIVIIFPEASTAVDPPGTRRPSIVISVTRAVPVVLPPLYPFMAIPTITTPSKARVVLSFLSPLAIDCHVAPPSNESEPVNRSPVRTSL